MLELLLAFALSTAAPQEPARAELAGRWTLNTDKSEDPNERIRVANRPTGGGEGIGARPGSIRGGMRGGIGGRVDPRPDRARPPGGLPPGDRDMPRDSSARVDGGKAMPQSVPGSAGEALKAIFYGADTLAIEISRDSVAFGEGAARYALRTDGKEHVLRRFNRDLKIKAKWKGQTLHIETKGDDDIRAKEEYEIKRRDDGRFLRVYAEMKLPTGRTAKIERLYDPLKP